jgi:hypothetical protein
MESIRLYAFRALAILVLFSFLLGIVSCIRGKNVVLNNQEESDATTRLSQINYPDYKVYVSPITLNKVKNLINMNIELGNKLLAPLERSQVTKKNVLLFDEEAHGYVQKYAVLKPFEYHFSQVSGFRLVGDILTIDYSGLLSPNTRVAMYKSANWYISVYRDTKQDEYSVIGSPDLTRWEQSSVSSPSPILLFERNSGVYALAGRKVWNVSEIDKPVLIKELDESIMKPDLPRRVGEIKDQDIIYSFNIDNYLVTHVYRVSEGSASMQFITINLDDFSHKQASAEEIVLGPYNYKAVKRDDGWKVYYIGRDPADGILVLDPLAENGPAVIERLPGVNIPPSQ